MYMVRVTRGINSREFFFKSPTAATNYIEKNALPGTDFDLCQHVEGRRYRLLKRLAIRSGTSFNYSNVFK